MTDEDLIFVDSDWKEQARLEKDRLSEEITQLPEEETNLFLVLVNEYIMRAAIALHGEETEEGIAVDVEAADYSISVLHILREKTEGNLSEEEQSTLNDAIEDLAATFQEIINNIETESGM